MELYDLGQQYLNQADTLISRIHALNRQSDKLSGNDKILMKRRISSLYSDAAECRRYAKILINYKERKN